MVPTRAILFTAAFVGLVAISRAQVSPIQPPSMCRDGIQDEFEQCDDGNDYNADGCSIDCLLEDEFQWLCNTTQGETTLCCSLFVNPVTLEEVCSCEDAVQPDARAGFTITSMCSKRDIDECNTDNGNCHVDATCTNFDIVASGMNITHKCECLPGLTGDGVHYCDL